MHSTHQIPHQGNQHEAGDGFGCEGVGNGGVGAVEGVAGGGGGGGGGGEGAPGVAPPADEGVGGEIREELGAQI